jgi:hypothetical protein
MYTLLHGFYKYLTQKDEFCVLILGLDNAGKTVIIIMTVLILWAISFEIVIHGLRFINVVICHIILDY